MQESHVPAWLRRVPLRVAQTGLKNARPISGVWKLLYDRHPRFGMAAVCRRAANSPEILIDFISPDFLFSALRRLCAGFEERHSCHVAAKSVSFYE
jgi:hypothetical protein